MQRPHADLSAAGTTVVFVADGGGGAMTRVERRGDIPLGELMEDFDVSCVLECDAAGTVSSRSMTINSPAATLRCGQYYVARRDHLQRCRQHDEARRSTHIRRPAGPPHQRLATGERRGRDEAEEPVDAEAALRKGVTFNNKIFVKEYNISSAVHSASMSNSHSFALDGAAPVPAPQLHRDAPHLGPAHAAQAAKPPPADRPLPPAVRQFATRAKELDAIVPTLSDEVRRLVAEAAEFLEPFMAAEGAFYAAAEEDTSAILASMRAAKGPQTTT